MLSKYSDSLVPMYKNILGIIRHPPYTTLPLRVLKTFSESATLILFSTEMNVSPHE